MYILADDSDCGLFVFRSPTGPTDLPSRVEGPSAEQGEGAFEVPIHPAGRGLTADSAGRV